MTEIDKQTIDELGLSFDELEEELNEIEKEEEKKEKEEQKKYTDIINIPQYEIKGECPEISDLVDTFKTTELIKHINKSSLGDNEKEFLKMAAYRHNAFSYSKIAEYYAHASEEMQELMEESALVIIDYEDALKNGYTTLKDELQEIMEEDKEF